MIVNLYADHMMASPPASAEEVWNATRVHAREYSDAAAKIGLTPAEYKQFRDALLDGKAVYVTLPSHVDAMAGYRHGYVYAVHNANIQGKAMGWKVALPDGAIVYVPQTCGNLSVLRQKVALVAPVKRPPHRLSRSQQRRARTTAGSGACRSWAASSRSSRNTVRRRPPARAVRTRSAFVRTPRPFETRVAAAGRN
jgi:hypothetical protein